MGRCGSVTCPGSTHGSLPPLVEGGDSEGVRGLVVVPKKMSGDGSVGPRTRRLDPGVYRP